MPSKNLLIALAASVILLVSGSYYLSQRNQATVSQDQFRAVTKQSSSDETEEIEKDLDETKFEGTDDDLLKLETELNSTVEAETK